MRLALALLLAATLAPTFAHAEPSWLLDEATPNAAWLDVGSDYSLLVVTAGYGRRLGPIELSTELTLPTAEPDFSDLRLRVAARWVWTIHGGWRVPVSLGLSAARGDNAVMTGWGLGLQPAVAPGYYAAGWSAAADLAYDWTFATHIEHSALYRELYYPEAVDGWYESAAGNLRLGARAALRLDDWVVALRGGLQLGGEYNQFLPGFYALLGGGYLF